MSTSRLPKFSSATIEPSMAITKICPWNLGTYWSMPAEVRGFDRRRLGRSGAAGGGGV